MSRKNENLGEFLVGVGENAFTGFIWGFIIGVVLFLSFLWMIFGDGIMAKFA